jgi:hypothetical protein
MKFLNQATISAILGFASTMAAAFGKPQLGAVFADPTLPQVILGVIGFGATLTAALSHPPASSSQ